MRIFLEVVVNEEGDGVNDGARHFLALQRTCIEHECGSGELHETRHWRTRLSFFYAFVRHRRAVFSLP